MSAYNAYQLRKRGDEQFGIEKNALNRNIANDSLAYNDVIRQRAKAGLGLNGIDPGSAGYNKRLEAELEGRTVDGSPIA